jgi:hypothetical protein
MGENEQRQVSHILIMLGVLQRIMLGVLQQ